jgi:hypothetical protein
MQSVAKVANFNSRKELLSRVPGNEFPDIIRPTDLSTDEKAWP